MGSCQAKMKQFVVLSALFALSFAEERGESYGRNVQCEGNEVVYGSCGSGKNDNCGTGIWFKLLCCDLAGYHFENCMDHYGEHGQNLECPLLDGADDRVLEGACGSGTYGDCANGSTHSVKCCSGRFDDGMQLQTTGQCYWSYGYYGEEVRCNFDDEIVFGRCGSGIYDDCGTEKWHGIQCCRMVKI